MRKTSEAQPQTDKNSSPRSNGDAEATRRVVVGSAIFAGSATDFRCGDEFPSVQPIPTSPGGSGGRRGVGRGLSPCAPRVFASSRWRFDLTHLHRTPKSKDTDHTGRNACATVLWMGALAAASLAGADRPGQIMSGYGEFANGINVRFTAVAEPPFKGAQGMPGGIAVRKDRIQRDMIDTTNRQYFGYDLLVEPAGGKRLRVTILPLSLQPNDVGDSLSPVLLPKYPPPEVVDDGDTIALDLLVSPDGRQKIVDYIQVGWKVEPPPAKTQAEPRDFTLDDGPLSFSFQSHTKLLLNGQPHPGQTGMTGKPGGTLWFSIPGRGRYVLSLAPHDGFQRAGSIRDNVIAFQADGEQVELRTSGPIVGSGGSWNLYLLRDPLFPSRNSVQYGTDRLDNLLPKR